MNYQNVCSLKSIKAYGSWPRVLLFKACLILQCTVKLSESVNINILKYWYLWFEKMSSFWPAVYALACLFCLLCVVNACHLRCQQDSGQELYLYIHILIGQRCLLTGLNLLNASTTMTKSPRDEQCMLLQCVPISGKFHSFVVWYPHVSAILFYVVNPLFLRSASCTLTTSIAVHSSMFGYLLLSTSHARSISQSPSPQSCKRCTIYVAVQCDTHTVKKKGFLMGFKKVFYLSSGENPKMGFLKNPLCRVF